MSQAKLDRLAELEGFDDQMDLLATYTVDSVCPAICTNPGCDHTEIWESDCSDGFCPKCETPTMKSALVLAHII